MGWVRPRRIFLQYAGSVAPSKSGGWSRTARVEKFTCAAVTPNLIPSPPPNLIPSPPLHSTAPSDRRRPAPSPASPPGLCSAGLAQRRPHLVRRARGATPPASRSARGAARPPASAPDRLRISARVAQRRPSHRAGPAWSAAPALPGPPPPRSRPTRLQVCPRSHPPAGLCPGPTPPSASDRLRIFARVAPPSASPRHLPRTGARSALCPGSLQVSTGLVLFCCYFFIAIS